MLKMIAIGNLVHDVELRKSKSGDVSVAVMRIASNRRYRDKDGNKIPDYISIKVRGAVAEYCAKYGRKGDKIAVTGDFETISFPDEPDRAPGFLIKANQVEFLTQQRAGTSESEA